MWGGGSYSLIFHSPHFLSTFYLSFVNFCVCCGPIREQKKTEGTSDRETAVQGISYLGDGTPEKPRRGWWWDNLESRKLLSCHPQGWRVNGEHGISRSQELLRELALWLGCLAGVGATEEGGPGKEATWPETLSEAGVGLGGEIPRLLSSPAFSRSLINIFYWPK
jgi:hypothetical protein